MRHLSPSLSARVAARHGVVTVDDLLGDGFTRHTVRKLVTASVLMGAHTGVSRLASSPLTFEARCVAACAADPSAVITGVSAARLWDFRHVFRLDEPVVLVEHDRTPLTTGVRLRRTNVLGPKTGSSATTESGSRVHREPGSTARATSTTSTSSG